jgi:hypothetical protein
MGAEYTSPMGLEANCKVRYDGQVSRGKALLETKELIFRGEFRLTIPFQEIRSAEARGGELHVNSVAAAAVFELGPQAEKWAIKILNPKSLLDKLGVKPDSRVVVLGVRDETFLADLSARVPAVAKRKVKESDLIFLAAEKREALEQLGLLQDFLKPNGGIWVVYPKGRKEITENDVRAAGKSVGLVDVKVAGFSDTHSALKLVIPLHRREK